MQQVMSYGGGVQSVAMCRLVAQERLPRPDRIVMADTDREASSTWEYLTTHVQPLLAGIGMAVEVAPHDLATRDLYDTGGGPLMPLFTATGTLRTHCSNEWKARVVRRHLRGQGITAAVQWLGFSLDERHRVKADEPPWYRRYPLLELMLTRHDCEGIITGAGLPLPHKSACWCCPYHSNAEWRLLRDHYPHDWQQAIALDEELRANDAEQAVYLHRSRVPLAVADVDVPDRRPEMARQCGLGNECWT
jgi:hypothetical protein